VIIDGGILGTSPSSVIDLTDDDNFVVLREGKGDITLFL